MLTAFQPQGEQILEASGLRSLVCGPPSVCVWGGAQQLRGIPETQVVALGPL